MSFESRYDGHLLAKGSACRKAWELRAGTVRWKSKFVESVIESAVVRVKGEIRAGKLLSKERGSATWLVSPVTQLCARCGANALEGCGAL